MNNIKLVRIFNVTNTKTPVGHFLDFGGTLIPSGKNAVVDLTKIDMEKHPGSTLDCLQRWVKEGIAKVVDAGDNSPIAEAVENEFTPGTRFNEVASSQLPETDSDDFEEDFDPALAKEADMPATATVGAHSPDNRNVGAAPKVSLSGEEPNWDNAGTSPIPGSKPRYVDDSEKFSVRAPRSTGPGGIVTK